MPVPLLSNITSFIITIIVYNIISIIIITSFTMSIIVYNIISIIVRRGRRIGPRN